MAKSAEAISKTIGIVGLGLIGASFAKAYKEKNLTSAEGENVNFRVLAYDIDESAVLMGKLAGFVDDFLPTSKLEECDLVLICLYPEACCKYLEENAALFKKGGLVMDTCGTKRMVCEVGFKVANENEFLFVGGHPMAGNKYSGLTHSRATLFNGAPMVIVPPVFDDMKMIDRVREALGPAQFGSFCLSHAEKHDELIAFTSQMAHLVSNAYIKSPSAKSHKGFSAGSYKDMTRVAWLNPEMWSELFIENKDNLISEIDCLTAELLKYRKAIEEDDKEALVKLLDEGRKRKEELDGGK